MKKILFLLIMFIITIFININANPIVIYWINEFSIDSSGWKLELHCDHAGGIDDSLLDGWFITSKSDTGFFKTGIKFNPEGYIVITNDSLQTKLKINPDGDDVTLFNSDSLYMDRLSFGHPGSMYSISCPKLGQSICRGKDPILFSNNDFLYLDNTPTFGLENDTLNSKGYIEGYVKDDKGNPLKDVKVIYAYYVINWNQIVPDSLTTDSEGYFKFRNFAKITLIYFKKDNYIDSNITFQIWPDSTVTIQDVKLLTGIVERIPSNKINEFYLSQNFPNPFNNSTSFFYTLPKGDYTVITIYDEKGAVVQKLFSGFQASGKYKINWNTDNLASGVYIYQLKTNSFSISKKAVLLK